MHTPNELFKQTLFLEAIPAGFPSPAEGYIDQALDLNQLLISHPAATFFVRVSGDSMQDAAIQSGDILVIDRALTPKHRDIVVAILNGEFTVKRLIQQPNCLKLVAENPQYQPIDITPETDFQVWGVVTYVIHKAQ